MSFLIIGLVALLSGILLNYYLRLAGMMVLIETGTALIAATILECVQMRIEAGKGTWRSVYSGVRVTCGIGFGLVVLSVIRSNLHKSVIGGRLNLVTGKEGGK